MKQNNNFLVEQENLQELISHVSLIGVKNSVDHSIAEGMSSGNDFFTVRTSQKADNDNLQIQLHFAKQEDGKFNLKEYRLTLYNVINLEEKGYVNQVIKRLDHDMRETDWYFDFAEDISAWTKGYKGVCKLEDELREIRHHFAGDKLVAYLWNNNVPPDSVDKPGFIRDIEEKLNLYPSKIFPAGTSVDNAFKYLNSYQQINDALSAYNIKEFNDQLQKESILGEIISGGKPLVTFERSVVPAAEIESFRVFTHYYPSGNDNGNLQSDSSQLIEYGSSSDFAGAWKLLHSAAQDQGNKANIPHWDVMVVGKYRDKQLAFNFEGSPEVNTGHILATAYPTSNKKNDFEYDVLFGDDLNKNVKVFESLHVQFEKENSKLIFSDIIKGVKQIDDGFWRKHSSDSLKVNEIDKAKSLEGKSGIPEKNSLDDLLPKSRVSVEKGRSIK